MVDDFICVRCRLVRAVEGGEGAREPVHSLQNVCGYLLCVCTIIHHLLHQLTNPYDIKPVLSSQTTIPPSQTKAMENIDTAAVHYIMFYYFYLNLIGF